MNGRTRVQYFPSCHMSWALTHGPSIDGVCMPVFLKLTTTSPRPRTIQSNFMLLHRSANCLRKFENVNILTFELMWLVSQPVERASNMHGPSVLHYFGTTPTDQPSRMDEQGISESGIVEVLMNYPLLLQRHGFSRISKKVSTEKFDWNSSCMARKSIMF